MDTLKDAVLAQIGDDVDDVIATAIDAATHGADAGFPGFCYYSDTVAFAIEHKALILDRLKQDAADFGMGLVEMVKGFRCLDGISEDSVGEAIYADHTTDSTEGDIVAVLNALAWYALETVGHELEAETV